MESMDEGLCCSEEFLRDLMAAGCLIRDLGSCREAAAWAVLAAARGL